MAQGYLVQLGNSSLDTADTIVGTVATFDTSKTIGAGQWIWSGTNGATTVTNQTANGSYVLGTDGNVYFIPNAGLPTTVTSAQAVNPPTYDTDVFGTGGTDANIEGDVADNTMYGGTNATRTGTGNDTFNAQAGDDTIYGGDGNDVVFGGQDNDSIEGGTGDDVLVGGQGADSIEGGSGIDTIYGDDNGAIAGDVTSFSWADQTTATGAAINDNQNVAGGVVGNTANGDVRVTMSVVQEGNFSYVRMEESDQLFDYNGRDDASSLKLEGGRGGGSNAVQDAMVLTLDFASNDPANVSDEVLNVKFGIFDLDLVSNSFTDQVIITAFDAAGNAVAVNITPGDTSTISVDNSTGTATSTGTNGVTSTSVTGFLQVEVAGPVASIVIDYNNINTAYSGHSINVGDLELTTIQTSEDAGNDDIIDGGFGDDEIYGGAGDDTIQGGQDADSISGGSGDDVIYGDTADSDAIQGEPTAFSWVDQSIGGTNLSAGNSVTPGITGVSQDGDIQVDMTITQEQNFTSAQLSTQNLYDYNDLNDNSSISLTGGAAGTNTNAATMTLDFTSNDTANATGEVMDLQFAIFDLDQFNNQFEDQVIITAFDAAGNPVPVTLVAGDTSRIITDDATGTATANPTAGNVAPSDEEGFFTINIAGPVARVVIDYNNINPAFGGHAIRVGDLEFSPVMIENDTNNNDDIAGDDGEDLIYAGSGDDTVSGGNDDDTLFGESGNDAMSGDAGDDVMFGGAGNDTVSGNAGSDRIDGGTGDDTIYGGADEDTLSGGSGDDTIFGGTGSDTILITDNHEGDVIAGGEDGDGTDVDTVVFSNFTSTQGVTVTATGDEAGTYDFDGTDGTGSYTEIEGFISNEGDDTFNLGADNSGVLVDTFTGSDTITTGSGDDTIFAGAGADTINAGAGNDQIDLGNSGGVPDGDDDVVILTDGFGDDVITSFDAPTLDGGGNYISGDVLDVTNLNDADGNPVNVNDVTVTPDANGAALLTFPNGETLLLTGIPAADADNPFYLNAIGIPLSDGTVEGTAGADVIDAGYTGDPDGDMIDAGDAILAGDSDNDDLIFGYGGDDTIQTGVGSDEAYGGTGNDTIISTGTTGDANTLSGDAGDDTIVGGASDDTILGGTGDDVVTIASGTGTDTIVGGEDVSGNDTDSLIFTDNTGTDGVEVTMTGDEQGTYSFPVDGGSGSFTEIEEIVLSDQNDVFDGVLAPNGSTVDGGAGNDVLTGSDGSDSFEGGSGNDTLNANEGDDTLSGGAGNDLFYGDGGEDVIFGGADNDEIYGGGDNDTIDGGTGDDTLIGGAGDDTLTGGAGADTIIGGADQDVIFGGGGDVIDGSESGVDNDTLFVSDVDFITYSGTNTENGTVSFNDGSTLVFTNIENVIVTDRDGTVSGTAGNDLINNSYLGDPDGDRVDNNDAILAGDTGNDDLIEAGAGNDTIFAGLGNDEIYAGSGNDTATGGAGNDTIFGEAGNDLLAGMSGNDTIFGGDNDDIINGGTGNDALFGGTGTDRFVQEDGFGTDTIVGGENAGDVDSVWSTSSGDVTVTMTGDEAGTLSNGANTATFTQIEAIETEDGNDMVDLSADNSGMIVDTGAGNDTVTGGTGNDTIATAGGNDTVFANAGNNTITLGTGNDTVTLGTGDDSVSGGTGSDLFNFDDASGTNTVVGGEGNGGIIGDVLNSTGASDVTVTTIGDEAGTLNTGTTTVDFTQIETIRTAGGDDSVDLSNDTSGMSVFTGAGDDVIVGGSGDDEIDGGAGDDTLSGGAGADSLTGGDGNDTLTFAEGDSVSGGAGDDLFVLEDLGELGATDIFIDGGAGDESLDPDGDGPLTGGDTLDLTGSGVLTNAVRDTFVDDGTGSFSGSITMADGSILTFEEIENIICFTPQTRIATPQGLIAVEDLQVGDMVVTRDHGLQAIRWIEGRTVPAVERFAPVTIRKNVLAGQERDLIVSPQHRVLFQGYRAELLFGESEVLVAAKHLIDGLDVTQDEAEAVTYVHILFDQHEVIFAEGAATESFHPGDIGFTAVGDEAREELFAIFPELRVDPRAYGATARRCLKAHESKLIRL